MEENKEVQILPDTELDESSSLGSFDQNVRSEHSNRMIEVYDQISNAEDVATMTACFLTISNYYNYAMSISNEINGRQGKSRMTVTSDTAQLMRYSLENDIDDILDKRLSDLFVSILNTYLIDKQELPSDPRKAAIIENRVKALIIMLVSTNQYGVIPLLNIPTYILTKVSLLFENLRKIKDQVLMEFIEYLESTGNREMAEIVRSSGNEFWGSEGMKANSVYDRHFGHLKDRIIKPVETYNEYKNFRARYRKSTKNVLPSTVYEVMNITPGAYDRARLNVYNEITNLFPEDENIKTVQRLIFEN